MGSSPGLEPTGPTIATTGERKGSTLVNYVVLACSETNVPPLSLIKKIELELEGTGSGTNS
jgi:hypothetical protein